MMELLLKGRGVRITDQLREAAAHRVARLDGPRRPSITRLEVEITEEATPRIRGGYRVQLSSLTTRRTFRSDASGPTIDAALDLAVERLNRQIDTYRSKREARVTRSSSHGADAQAAGRAAEETA